MYDIRSFLTQPPTDDELRAGLKQWQDDVYSALADAGKMTDPRVKFGGSIPLQLLDPRQQIDFMARYRKLIGLDEVLGHLATMGPGKMSEHLRGSWGLKDSINAQVMNIWENLTSDKSVSADSPYGRFRGNPNDNSLLGQIYRSINLQLYDRSNRSTRTGIVRPKGSSTVRQYFGIGSIPTLENLEKPGFPDLRNKSVFVFDLETAGFRPGSVREFAYKAFNVGDDGIIDFGALSRGDTSIESDSVVFRPVQGTRGSMMFEGNAVSVDEFLRLKYGLDATVGSNGEDFIDKVVPLLRKASEYDVVVGHNTEGFDFNYLYESLKGTKRYKTDKGGFRQEIDDLFDTLHAKSVDTLRLVRQAPNLQGLEVFKDALGNPIEGMTPYSIQNLLLNTDLAKRVGFENITRVMGMTTDKTGTILFEKGLHFGDIDVLDTLGILGHMPDLEQKSIIEAAETPAEKRIAEAIVSHSLQAAAITPFTDYRDPTTMHQRVLDKVGPNAKINPIEHEIILTRDMQMHDSQKVLQTAIHGADPHELARNFGAFDRMIGRVHGQSYSEVYDRLVKPNSTEYAAYQNQLAKLGFGFSGLSYEERLYGTALSDITLRNLPGMRGNIARETLTSQFQLFNPTEIEYVTTSGKLTLPMQVLEEAKLLEKSDDPANYLLSVVRPTVKKPTPSINLAYKFTSTEDKNAVVRVLGEMIQDENRFYQIMRLEGDTGRRAAYEHFLEQNAEFDLTNLIHSDPDVDKYGVTVAQILDEDAAREIMDLEGSVNNRLDLKDTQRLQMAVYHGEVAYEPGGGGTVTTRGVALQQGLDSRDKTSVARSIEASRAMYDTETGMKGIGSSARASVAARFYDRGSIQTERMDKMFRFFDKTVVPNVPKLALGGVIAGAGAYLWSRKRRNDQYDMDFAYESREPGPARYAVADVLQARIDAGYDGGRVQIDPLATANLTHHLYYSSIGHTNMEWDRNNAIYGGVL